MFAHPDYETFGLGAVLGALVDAGTAVDGLCFTRGEASTLHPDVDSPGQLCDLGDLGAVRAVELADAARLLGLDHCEPPHLSRRSPRRDPLAVLAAHVLRAAQPTSRPARGVR